MLHKEQIKVVAYFRRKGFATTLPEARYAVWSDWAWVRRIALLNQPYEGGPHNYRREEMIAPRPRLRAAQGCRYTPSGSLLRKRLQRQDRVWSLERFLRSKVLKGPQHCL